MIRIEDVTQSCDFRNKKIIRTFTIEMPEDDFIILERLLKALPAKPARKHIVEFDSHEFSRKDKNLFNEFRRVFSQSIQW